MHTIKSWHLGNCILESNSQSEKITKRMFEINARWLKDSVIYWVQQNIIVHIIGKSIGFKTEGMLNAL